MSRIQTLDEITSRLGAPELLRWVDVPGGAAAAVVRLRHRGAVINLNPSGTFRLLFQLSSSQVLRGQVSRGQVLRDSAQAATSRETVRAGSIITSFIDRPESIRVLGYADTLHLLFSPELTAARSDAVHLPPARRELQAMAVQTLVAASLSGTDAQLQQAVSSIAQFVVNGAKHEDPVAGGFTPQARRAMLEMLEKRLGDGVSVPELAEAANLSLHHFIKVCRQSEGLTPHALLMQKRIELSIELLLEGDSTLEEIAMLVGFSSPSHFISTFRRMIGVSPAVLRRAARQ
jgi:AraC-like DNA-binding protein